MIGKNMTFIWLKKYFDRMDLFVISTVTLCNLPEIKELCYRALGFCLYLNMKAHPQEKVMIVFKEGGGRDSLHSFSKLKKKNNSLME